MPAKPIAVPGTKPFGLARNLFKSSNVQVPPLPFMAAEKLNPPLPSPFFSLTVPNRFGPTRLGPPLSKVWHAAHFLAAAAPFSTEAVCSSFSIGSAGGGGFLGRAGVVVFLHRDIVTRLFQLLGSKNRARGEARHQQNEAGGQNGAHNFIEFEGVHFRSGSGPEFCH